VTDSRQLAEAVRAACIQAALDAYEEGGVLGLCAEGRWEYAISAMRQLDVAAVVAAHLTGLSVEKHDGNRSELSSGQPP
jgi:hypothetical protein